jgi:hypothetical protein
MTVLYATFSILILILICFTQNQTHQTSRILELQSIDFDARAPHELAEVHTDPVQIPWTLHRMSQRIVLAGLLGSCAALDRSNSLSSISIVMCYLIMTAYYLLTPPSDVAFILNSDDGIHKVMEAVTKLYGTPSNQIRIGQLEFDIPHVPPLVHVHGPRSPDLESGNSNWYWRDTGGGRRGEWERA